MTVTEARERWGALLKIAEYEAVTIRRRGREVCVFVPVAEYNRIHGIDSQKSQQVAPRHEK